MTENRFRAWLVRNRTSARMAFVMRLITMALGVLTSLGWIRLFVQLLGPKPYGLLASFQNLMRFAGIGDFGITGALGLRTGQMLGRGEQDHLRDFLASARTLFLLLALAISAAFAALSPWLPGWLGFPETPGAGSLTYLFCAGGMLILLNFTAGYFNSINSGCNTVMWPILPMFLISQTGQVLQWLVARQGGALWQMILAQAAVAILNVGFGWWMLRSSFPQIARLKPLGCNPALWRELTATSGWVCLYVLGNLIFTTTDVLLINAGFGPGTVTPYFLNYKLVELALSVVLSASAVSQTKINFWIANPAPESQQRARQEVRRLNLFETVAGVGCAIGFLAISDLFIRTWQVNGSRFLEPLSLQLAFALNLAVTTGGDAGIQMAGLCGKGGLRVAGLTIGLTGLLNLGLSLLAVRAQWIAGIAYATVVAQTVLSVVLTGYTCRHLKMPLWPWLVRAWLLPVVVVALFAGLRYEIGGSGQWGASFLLLLCGAVIMFPYARAAGVTVELIRHEWSIVRGMLEGK